MYFIDSDSVIKIMYNFYYEVYAFRDLAIESNDGSFVVVVG